MIDKHYSLGCARHKSKDSSGSMRGNHCYPMYIDIYRGLRILRLENAFYEGAHLYIVENISPLVFSSMDEAKREIDYFWHRWKKAHKAREKSA